MINGKRVLALIPARGGSKGIPKKNVIDLGGKPLIAWTIEEAKKSEYIDQLTLSSDDHEIINTAKQYGCEVPFFRPKELAADNTPVIDPIIHALTELPGFDYVVLLQPTSPFRTVGDIDSCIKKCVIENSNVVVSVTETDKSPYWMFNIDDEDFLHPILSGAIPKRRQDSSKVYLLNGAVYVANVNWLIENKTFISSETRSYVMPKDRSIDIDDVNDLAFARYLINAIQKY